MLTGIARPSLVLIPDHGGREALEELAFAAFGQDVIVAALPSSRVPAEIGPDLAAAESILVMDDSLVTGITLARIRRSIYTLAQEHDGNPHTEAFVVVAATSEEQVRVVKRPYGPTAFHTTYEVLLPSGRDCPWCDESELLNAWEPRLPEASRGAAVHHTNTLRATFRKPTSSLVNGTSGGPAFAPSSPTSAIWTSAPRMQLLRRSSSGSGRASATSAKEIASTS